jgi:hypothetical protein
MNHGPDGGLGRDLLGAASCAACTTTIATASILALCHAGRRASRDLGRDLIGFAFRSVTWVAELRFAGDLRASGAPILNDMR